MIGVKHCKEYQKDLHRVLSEDVNVLFFVWPFDVVQVRSTRPVHPIGLPVYLFIVITEYGRPITSYRC